MSDHDHGGDHGHEYHSHGALYFSIFIALCIFTVISYVADLFKEMPYPALVGIVMSVAVCKALCVMIIFMHLKFERAWKYLLLAPTAILACTVPFALAPDVGFHYYTVVTPQRQEYERREALGLNTSSHGGHAPAEKPHH